MRQFWLVCSVIAVTGTIAGNVTATRSTPPAATVTAATPLPAAAPTPASSTAAPERPTAAVWRWQQVDPDHRPPRRWNRYDRDPNQAWSNRTWPDQTRRNWRPRLPPSGEPGFAWRRPFYDRRFSGNTYPPPPRWSDRYGSASPRQYRSPDRNAPYRYAGRSDERPGHRWVWAPPRDRYQR